MPRAVAANSGTSSLHLAAMAAGIRLRGRIARRGGSFGVVGHDGKRLHQVKAGGSAQFLLSLIHI